MAQSRTTGGKFAKKEQYKCPNCGHDEYLPVIDQNMILKSQKKCANCAHVLTQE